MSAAAPTPPPHRVPIVSTNGFDDSGRRGNSNGQPRHYAHIKDLAASAEDQINPKDSISRLLTRASNALQSARANIDFQRPDYALVEYLVAQIILSRVVPGHPDSLLLQDQKSLRAMYSESIKTINHERTTIDQLEGLVRLDNQRSGIKAVAVDARNGDAHADASVAWGKSEPPTQVSGSSRPKSARYMEAPNHIASMDQRNSMTILPDRNASPRDSHTRPPIHAKPQKLQGHAIDSSDSDVSSSSKPQKDPLLARFSQLRVGRSAANAEISGSLSSDGSSIRQNAPSQQSRPAIFVKSDLAKDLPKVPSPTYSPARAVTDGRPYEPRPQDRSSLITNSDTASLASTASTTYQPIHNGYEQTNGRTASSSQSYPRTKGTGGSMPQETEIGAQRLYDYLNTFEVLLIDVRSREEFDDGHIFSRNIVCIEPSALRPNKSAEELQESLVVGTDQEYSLFSSRDEFGLVVYFDQSTTNTEFLTSRHHEQSPLRCLHDSLTQFNQDKPLKWRPILLVGGVDAWLELVGPQSLVKSNTAANRLKEFKPSRPIARRPVASNVSRLSVARKRHRDYNPVTPEEEQKWRERARSESVSLNMQQPLPDEIHDEEGKDKMDYPGMDDFQRRYPDVASVESRMLATRPPSRPPPEAPRTFQYPNPPAPTIPSRPPPAVARQSYGGVSERAVQQSPAVSKISHLPPYIPPKLLRLPKTGLHNFGVTCYMNATIQCLSATIPLTLFFLDNQYKREIQRDNWKGSKGLMPELYNTLLTNLWRWDDIDTIRPTNFRKFCARLNREWGYDRQQDAKEFLEFLIDTLHEDFNVNWMRNPLRTLNDEEEAARERTPSFFASKLEFDRYLHRDKSKLSELFAGQHLSRLQCTTCHNSSTTYETFWSISVEIPPAPKGRPVSIYDCLHSYCSSEMLSGEEVWRCPHCKKEREATKRITITRAPQFLVIHFKRFSASHAERARKVHTPVEFPLTGLDLGPYMLAPPDQTVRESLQRRYGPEALEAPVNMTPPYKYDAYAVLRHIGGTMTSGHYISLVEDKSKGYWREFNDDRVNDFRPEQLSPSRRLQNEQAYIVFYQRIY